MLPFFIASCANAPAEYAFRKVFRDAPVHVALLERERHDLESKGMEKQPMTTSEYQVEANDLDAIEEKRRLEQRYGNRPAPVEAPVTSQRPWQLPSVPTLLREHVFPRVPHLALGRQRVREVTEEEGLGKDEKVALLE